MIAFTGALLLVLGLVSGIFLALSPLGLGPPSPGVTTWILFPGFTVVGYILLAASARLPLISIASRLAGALLLLLALGAAVALFAIGGALLQAPGETLALWYVTGLGLVLGATGFAIGRASAGVKPTQT
ncbi:MAG TPA: hypothetical protein VF814_21160 [Casimicrobiaceae bacterium]